MRGDGGCGGDAETVSVSIFGLFLNEVNAERVGAGVGVGVGVGVGGERVKKESVEFEAESAVQIEFGPISGDELWTADRVKVKEVDDEQTE